MRHQDLEIGKGVEPDVNLCHVSWNGAGLVIL